ncbi:ABC transporter ATP-binding protein [Lederbergia wuyishanensis]|uniref:ATP-binding cassette subfamily B protein AbcA/BmrA n=1 Tax=Lederbergia wuyishanensis TaxID=1347903 RepID=A0ABU0D888_9BACI|nr:ABC transporter ATP-binding protein [Lederbergia wuyishanensis]MDQ0344617.1 ATP-binding cassette subfamily B protein AbcA/BmrA [Lederbergia wuyishanensis]
MEKDMPILKKHNEKGIWKAYFKLMFKAKLPWGWLIFVILAFLASSTVTLIFPQYVQKIYEGVLRKEVIYGAITVLVVGILVDGIVRYFNKLLMYKIDVSYRSLIWERLMLSPLSLYDRVKPTEMISRVTNDAATISQVLGSWVPTLIASVYYTIATIAILFNYDWRLGLSVFIYVPIYLLFNIYYGKWNYRANKLAFNRLSQLTQFLSELLMSVPLIKTFVTETKEEQRGKEYLQSYYKASFKRAIVNWVENPISGILSITQEILVIAFGVYLVKSGAITLSQWIGFFMYVGMLWPTLMIFIYAYMEMKRSQGATSRIADLIDSPLEDIERKFNISSLDEDITFNKVSFSYVDNNEILSDLDFTIRKGKVTAIVGPSGSGKSTIFSLLQQFYKPNSGTITIGDDKLISEINLRDWRNLFSYVAQDSPLISGTIRENIVYGVNREVSELEINRAAEAANALQFIREFPNGYETDVGEGGANLSGGQRQRIAIARAILRDAPILLFDEATASLDSQSEKSVQEAMKKLMESHTTIMIAHDLSTIRDADQIILLDSGKVDGIGTHEQLMETNELYKLFVQLHMDSQAG